MAQTSLQSGEVQMFLNQLRVGDSRAREELFRRVGNRLEKLARKMLRGFPGVQRWAQTDDVLQSALVRLLRALDDVHPESAREFFALSTEQIRRELIDLARHFYGPHGVGANHASTPSANGTHEVSVDPSTQSNEPSLLSAWTEFHQQVAKLPREEREVVDLLFYQELPQAEASELLGVTVRTVQRRWQSALLRLHDILKHSWPGL